MYRDVRSAEDCRLRNFFGGLFAVDVVFHGVVHF